MESQPEKAAADATSMDGVESWVSGMPPKRRGLALIATSVLLVALGTVGVLYTGNLVWINRLEHPFVFGCIAAATFGAGLLQLITKRWVRVLVGLISGLGVIGWLCIGVLWLMFAGTWTVASADAPGDSDYQAVVREGSDLIDTVWYISIQQTRGPLSREWYVGCLSNDLEEDSFEDVSWRSPSRLLVRTAGQTITVPVDPETGKPQSRIIPMAARGSC